MKFTFFFVFFSLILISCGGKESTANTTDTKKPVKKTVSIKQDPTPVCKLSINDLIGSYANKAGFSARVKLYEKDPTKLEFIFQSTKGCKRKYSGIATKEEYYSVDEVNYVSKDTVDKIAIEISMFFTEGKLSIAERTSEKKDKKDSKCIFEGHLTKLK